jgi:hypothetical protein
MCLIPDSNCCDAAPHHQLILLLLFTPLDASGWCCTLYIEYSNLVAYHLFSLEGTTQGLPRVHLKTNLKNTDEKKKKKIQLQLHRTMMNLNGSKRSSTTKHREQEHQHCSCSRKSSTKTSSSSTMDQEFRLDATCFHVDCSIMCYHYCIINHYHYLSKIWWYCHLTFIILSRLNFKFSICLVDRFYYCYCLFCDLDQSIV